MLNNLQTKVETIAEKYADLVDNRIQSAINEKEVDGIAMIEINNGIRMLNHVASTLERIVRIQHGDNVSETVITLGTQPLPLLSSPAVKKMVEKEAVMEILGKQLKLLSEQAEKTIEVEELCQLNTAICKTVKVLQKQIIHQFGI